MAQRDQLTLTEAEAELLQIEQDTEALCSRVLAFCECVHPAKSHQNPPALLALEQVAVGVRSSTRAFTLIAALCLKHRCDL